MAGDGIRRPSAINKGLAYALSFFVVIVGPTFFLLKTTVGSLGRMQQNFIRRIT